LNRLRAPVQERQRLCLVRQIMPILGAQLSRSLKARQCF
jgi:hypothetical protein